MFRFRYNPRLSAAINVHERIIWFKRTNVNVMRSFSASICKQSNRAWYRLCFDSYAIYIGIWMSSQQSWVLCTAKLFGYWLFDNYFQVENSVNISNHSTLFLGSTRAYYPYMRMHCIELKSSHTHTQYCDIVAFYPQFLVISAFMNYS